MPSTSEDPAMGALRRQGGARRTSPFFSPLIVKRRCQPFDCVVCAGAPPSACGYPLLELRMRIAASSARVQVPCGLSRRAPGSEPVPEITPVATAHSMASLA